MSFVSLQFSNFIATRPPSHKHDKSIVLWRYYIRPSPIRLLPRSKSSFPQAFTCCLGRSGLLVNTGSGGHAFLGYYLSRWLQEKGHQITLLNAGSAESLGDSYPFSDYPELEALGIKVAFSESIPQYLEENKIKADFLVDNYSKEVSTARSLVEFAKETGVTQYLYISSAGIYEESWQVPHLEDDPVKEDSSIRQVEKLLMSYSQHFWSTCFRPIYLIGTKSAKTTYTDYFFDRLIRREKVPLPYPGEQLVSLSHIMDLVTMIASAIGEPKAYQQILNATSGRFLSFYSLATLCAEICDCPLQVEYYNTKVTEDKAFPFRKHHFIADSRKAMALLNWSSTTDLKSNIKEMFSEYLSLRKGH
eukprot:jgi/Galph1/5747/GphlegSOOS_G4371.1